jgi:hypothetical protein
MDNRRADQNLSLASSDQVSSNSLMYKSKSFFKIKNTPSVVTNSRTSGLKNTLASDLSATHTPTLANLS